MNIPKTHTSSMSFALLYTAVKNTCAGSMFESPYAEKFRSLKLTGETFTGPTGYFANMVADAVSCVREPGHRPVSSAADGLRVIEYLNSVKA